MFRHVLLLFVTASLLTQSTPIKKDALPEPYDIAEAYAVYSAIVPSELADANTVFIRTETEPYRMCLQPGANSEKVIGGAIADYLKTNTKTWLLQRMFKIEKPYEFISADELKTTFQQGGGGWDSFYERHPGSAGWIELSAVGFSSDKTVAIVYMGHHCHWLCGGGTFHVLQKKDGKWEPLKWGGTACAWAS